ncbi:MAG: DUF1615 domain-containing protein [Rhodocyclaceae bacterium]
MNDKSLRIAGALSLAALVGACATPGGYESKPWPPRPESRPTQPATPLPPAEKPISAPPVKLPPLETPAAPTPPAALPYPGLREGSALAARFLPDHVADRKGWATDIFRAFAALRIAPTPENFCTAVAVIDQESTFHADPVVPGLAAIARKEIDTRRERYGIPRLLLDAALEKKSRNGRSYKARIDSLRTEREMSMLFEDMISELPYGQTLFNRFNPVRTGGPMQVSIEFAEDQVRAAPYPYRPITSVRHEVFTRRGGLYFGIAYLLDYPAPYADPLYRFADFNAGRYSARNAAFQNAVMKIGKRRLSLDGDLLNYSLLNAATGEPSETQRALEAVAAKLRMNSTEIRRDLSLEKSAGFQDTALYAKVYALADQANGSRLPRAMSPQIDLKSPKIKRKLTTDWFAQRVNGRYRTCLARAEPRPEPPPQAAR